jgi:hypothetical protein
MGIIFFFRIETKGYSYYVTSGIGMLWLHLIFPLSLPTGNPYFSISYFYYHLSLSIILLTVNSITSSAAAVNFFQEDPLSVIVLFLFFVVALATATGYCIYTV